MGAVESKRVQNINPQEQFFKSKSGWDKMVSQEHNNARKSIFDHS